MNVIEVTEFGGPDVLRPAVRPTPAGQPGQVVVRVRAANVNPTDLAARAGHGPRGIPQPPFVLGWDFAGDVQAAGEGVTDLTPGDRVVGMIHWYDQHGAVGAYAQEVAVDAGWVVLLPDSLDYALAATIPLNALSAAQGLDLLGLTGPAALLVTGASGAVGSFAVQLAAQAGHRVIALASRGDEDWARALGATEVLPRDADLSAIEPVPAVFDAVPLGEPALAAAQDGGAVVTTRQVPAADPARRIRQQAFLIHPDRERMRRLVDAVARGRLRTRVDRVLPLAEAAEAHRLNEAGGLRGKIILAP
ncbi:MAG TPA: NADP-dependent oxidoreductase [Streptosporangiaceae bacterium]|nr:NADP-dependent oxidoreductase [Streptosporangiaceae bacterium]